MRQAIGRHIEGPIAEQILSGELCAGDVARIGLSAAGAVHIATVPASATRA